MLIRVARSSFLLVPGTVFLRSSRYQAATCLGLTARRGMSAKKVLAMWLSQRARWLCVSRMSPPISRSRNQRSANIRSVSPPTGAAGPRASSTRAAWRTSSASCSVV